MKVKKIHLPEDMVNYLQRLSFEENSYRDVISFLLPTYKEDASFSESPLFKEYKKEHIRAKVEYEYAKKELTDRFIPEELKEHKYNVQIDPFHNELVIQILCECGEALI